MQLAGRFLLFLKKKMSSKRLSLGTHFLSSKKKEDLTELFQSFDKDNDGKISYQEFNELLHSTGIDNTTAVTIMVIKTMTHHYIFIYSILGQRSQ